MKTVIQTDTPPPSKSQTGPRYSRINLESLLNKSFYKTLNVLVQYRQRHIRLTQIIDDLSAPMASHKDTNARTSAWTFDQVIPA